MQEVIVNKVANSGIVTINLEDYYTKGKRSTIDLTDFLFEGLILREKDFREKVKATDWSTYQDSYVAIYCSADAIVPTWAYMLLAIALEPFATKIVFGTNEVLEATLIETALNAINPKDYTDKRVVVKGCGDINLSTHAYVKITTLLKPYVKSIMYGEPCSTVPLYKK